MPRKTGRPHAGADGRGRRASMRPRPDAAENQGIHAARGFTPPGFNEAAARCRGKPPATTDRTDTRPSGFNEAAARCRGKPRDWLTEEQALKCFNEAAARCRGKPRPPKQPSAWAAMLQ